MVTTSDANGSGAAAPALEVAVVGGGVVGVMTAIGLGRRGIKATIYERAPAWNEVSAGFAFTAAARVWMEMLEPALVELLGSISQKTDNDTSIAYWDGFHARTRADAEDESKSLLFRTPTSNLRFWGCVRSQFLKGMGDMLPEGVTRFGKQLVSYDDEGPKVVLRFEDGTTAEADVLLGCDGIHSATRRLMLGADHPASRPGFSHSVAYRTMVPMDAAVEALGTKVAKAACNHVGPNAGLVAYPVMSGTVLNIGAFGYEPGDFPDGDKMTVQGDRGEIERLFRGWSPPVADIWKLYPEKVTKWGIYDLVDSPPPTCARGRACLVGDSAHASTPYLGVGACTGVEDALVICTLLQSVQLEAIRDGRELRAALTDALQTYSRARRDRGRWVSRTSRQMGEMYHWRYGPTGRDPERMRKKVEENWREAVNYDIFAGLDPGLRELAADPNGARTKVDAAAVPTESSPASYSAGAISA